MDRKTLEEGAGRNSFCVLPWIHLYACEEGILRPCCIARAQEKLVNRDASGRPHVIYDPDRIEEAWNSDFMREIRREMLSGVEPPVCHLCYRDERLGLSSHRNEMNRHFDHLVDEALARTDADGSAPADLIRSVDLRLGNLCNLRCRMCAPLFSKALIAEWAELCDRRPDEGRLAELGRLDWFDRPEVWTMLERHVPRMERLHFAGGEPLISRRMVDFLERIVEMGAASRIDLSYNTNLSVIPDRVVDLWPRFRGVDVTVSLDGFGEVNSLIRAPSRWEAIERNVRWLDSIDLGWNPGINVTVQALNVFRLHELIGWVATELDRFDPPQLSLLTYPRHFGIQILPPEMKDRAATRLEQVARDFEGRWPKRWEGPKLDRLLAGISGVVEHMRKADHGDALPEFRRWTRVQDENRGQRTVDVVPELSPILLPDLARIGPE